jgi:hypothetical protein
MFLKFYLKGVVIKWNKYSIEIIGVDRSNQNQVNKHELDKYLTKYDQFVQQNANNPSVKDIVISFLKVFFHKLNNTVGSPYISDFFSVSYRTVPQ